MEIKYFNYKVTFFFIKKMFKLIMLDFKEYEIIKHGLETILKINYIGKGIFPSIEDDSYVMADTIKKIIQNPSVTKIIFSYNKNYEYSSDVVKILKEIGEIYVKLTRNKSLFQYKSNKEIVNENQIKEIFRKYTILKDLILKDLLRDPIGTYIKIKRLIRDCEFEKNYKEKDGDENFNKNYYYTLLKIYKFLEDLTLLKTIKKKLDGHEIGDRKIYKNLIKSNVKPNFIYTSLIKKIPFNSKLLASYELEDAKIKIFELEDKAYNLYHIIPKEFELSEDKYNILNLAKEVISEHAPKSNDFTDPTRLREIFYNISNDLLKEISEFKRIELSLKELKLLSNILIKYTVGFGLVETLLEDENIQDISINSPSNKVPMFVTHNEFEDCITNIIPEKDEIDSWASRLRIISGKSFDSANPLLDTEIETPNARARVSAIGPPLNSYGIGFSFRRHRDKPWTLQLFIKNKMINSEAAGLLSFIIDGARTFLIVGTRGSGKSSFLTAMMIEILRKYRIITIEDTLEIPTIQFTELNYNIQSLNVKSALSTTNSGTSADMGIRSTLRLGDSCLIIGEVRSTEALALYEAMRVGALANVVGGTIHGDSPYGIYDRLVNDLKVPKTSFKATDLIIIANPIRSSDGLSRKRRITSIHEVKKNWENDPIAEEGFNELFSYDAEDDCLKISESLKSGDCDVLKSIAQNIPEFIGNWDGIWENIELRGKIKQYQVDKSIEIKNDGILEAKYCVEVNDYFHKICESVSKENGKLDSKIIYEEFCHWYDYYIENYLENK